MRTQRSTRGLYGVCRGLDAHCQMLPCQPKHHLPGPLPGGALAAEVDWGLATANGAVASTDKSYAACPLSDQP